MSAPVPDPARLALAALTALVALTALLALAPTQALATAAQEREGARVLVAVERGVRPCPGLTRADYQHVGQFVVARLLGSQAAQADTVMVQMLGVEGTLQTQIALGRRFTRCGAGSFPPGFADLMSNLGAVLGGSGSFEPATPAGAKQPAGGGGWPGVAIALVAILGVLLAAALALVTALARRSRNPAP